MCVESMVTQNQLLRIWVYLLVDFPSPTQLKKYLMFKLLGLDPREVGLILVDVFQPFYNALDRSSLFFLCLFFPDV